MEHRFSFRRFFVAWIAFVIVLAIGTVGFVLLTDEGWAAAFYRSVVSTTLTGLDSRPEGTASELFTVVLLLAGVAIFLYLAGAVVELITRGVVGEYFGEGRRRRAIGQLRDHTIICGFGRVGRSVAAEFEHAGSTFVVIDINADSIKAAAESGTHVVHGDGTEDAHLETAGLAHARALVASADSDVKNLFITLSARASRPDIFIVARASDDSAARKLHLAGADRVVQPYSSAGLRIANLVLKPQVADYLDIVSTAGGDELRFEEITVEATCPAVGHPLRDLHIRDATGAMIVAIRRGTGAFVATPGPDEVLGTGDVLIGVGSKDEIRRLEELFAPQGQALADPVGQLAAALAEAAGAPVILDRPADAAHGDYATNVALQLAGRLRRPPREIAEELAAAAATIAGVVGATVAGPGFVNLELEDTWFTDALGAMLEAGSDFGGGSAATPERVQVEMVSANPTGPMTVAAARNGAYGDCVARLLAFAGHDVEREYYYNDAGAQMDKFRASVDAARRGDDPPEDGYHGDYIAELAREDGDPVPQMLSQIEAALERFRIHFDTFERQSVVELEVPEAIALLETYEEEGALWARTSAHGDEKDRVLVRSDGTPTYFAADAAYVRRKYGKGFDRLVYVLGADHHGYVGRLQALSEMFGHPRGSLEVLIYQLVHLTKRGEATKMSKRRGDVVILDEFIDEIGIDAARWYLVSRGHDQTIEIDVDLAAEKTAKNPVFYVQYAHARIAGILRNAPEGRVPNSHAVGPLTAEEKDLVKRIAEFPGIAAEATTRRAPHAVPTYAIRLADDFHRFYHHHKVLGSPEEAFRLGLCTAAKAVIARCLDLVGVEAPDSM